MPKKAGRPPKYVYSSAGEMIIGLSKDSKGYYFNTHFDKKKGKKKTFGKELDKAIYLYHQWIAEQNNQQVDVLEGQVEVVHKHTNSYSNLDALTDNTSAALPEELQNVYKIPEALIWKQARELLLNNDIKTTRKKLGLYISIDEDVSPRKSTSLEKIETVARLQSILHGGRLSLVSKSRQGPRLTSESGE